MYPVILFETTAFYATEWIVSCLQPLKMVINFCITAIGSERNLTDILGISDFSVDIEANIIENTFCKLFVEDTLSDAFFEETLIIGNTSLLSKVFSSAVSHEEFTDLFVTKMADFAHKKIEELLTDIGNLNYKHKIDWLRSFFSRLNAFKTILNQTKKHQKTLVINKNITKALKVPKFPYFTAAYLSSLLVDYNNRKIASFGELFLAVDEIMLIFMFIDDKLAFEHWHRVMLVDRLSNGEFSEEAENKFIMLLKVECGAVLTQKLEQILKDRLSSLIVMSEFMKSKLAKNIKSKAFVDTVTDSSWPVKQLIINSLPDFTVVREFAEFKKFFTRNNAGKTMEINLAAGSVEVVGNFKKGTYWIKTTIIQSFLVEIFNKTKTITWKKLLERLVNIPEDVVRSNLAPMLKIQMISLTVDGKNEDDSVITLNEGFHFKNKKIRLDKSIKAEDIHQPAVISLERERKYIVEANIVRLMKGHKVCDFEVLLGEVTTTIKQFKAEVRFVKEMIENLIQRNFLVRAKNSKQLIYNY